MPEQQKATEASEINSRIDALNGQLEKARMETRKYIEKRDKLNEEFKRLRQETQELKPERDSLNEKVQTLKMLRDETRSKIRAIIEDIKVRQEKIVELRKATPKVSYQRLKKEQEDIDWRIQTMSLDLLEEKRLVEEVKQLEVQMVSYKRIEKQQRKIAELRNELSALDEKADAFHKELSAVAEKSQEIHQKMMMKFDESKRIKGEADGLHQAYLKAKLAVASLKGELIGVLVQRKKLRHLQREEEQKKRLSSEQEVKEKQQVLKEKLESQAREKLQRGEKLSWDEFQLLAEDETEAQN